METSEKRFRAKIIRTVRHYDPKRLPQLPRLFDNIDYKNFQTLWNDIEAHYGEEPPNPYAHRVYNFYEKYHPRMNESTGNVEAMFTRSIFALHLADAVLTPFDTVRTVLRL